MSLGRSRVSTLAHPDLQVTRCPAQVNERKLFAISELSGNINLGVNNADIGTLECALLERMYFCKVKGKFEPPLPVTTGKYRSDLKEFSNALSKFIGHSTPVSLDEVVEMYKGRKKMIYQQANDILGQRAITRRDGYLNTFVKLEKVKPDGAPRCIQPRDKCYNIELAAYIKPVEHRIYHAIKKIFKDGPTVIKGFNIKQIGSIVRGKWNSFRKPAGFGLDAVKFDMHVSVEALKWEHSVYNKIYRCRKLNKLLAWQLNNIGRGYCKDGKLKYKVEGRRASGDMNTALGNCLIMCALVYTFAKLRGVDIKLCNNGDDCFIMCESEDLDRLLLGIDQWFGEMGFRLTTEKPVFNLNQIEFCQMRPIELEDGSCIMVRNIQVALRKDTMCIIDLTSVKVLKSWLTAVGRGGLSLTGGIPIIQNLYRKYITLGCGVVSKISEQINRHSGLFLISQGMTRQFSLPSAEVRCQVFIAWGITPDEQLAIEEYIDSYQFNHQQISAVDNHFNYSTELNELSW